MHLHLPFLGVWIIFFLASLWVCSRLAARTRRSFIFWLLAALGSLLISYALTVTAFALVFQQF